MRELLGSVPRSMLICNRVSIMSRKDVAKIIITTYFVAVALMVGLVSGGACNK